MEMLLDGLISLVAIGVLVAYAWSVKAHFFSEVMAPGARAIAAMVVITAAVYFYLTWFQSQPPLAALAGLVVMLAGAALFAITIRASRAARLRFVFDDAHPHTLLNEGPYRYVRHPFYVSYCLFWMGWALSTWSAWALINIAIMLVLYVRAAQVEERKFAQSPLGADYAAYRGRVGFFIPRLG